MNVPATLAEIASLSVNERLCLVEAIWETIVAEPGQPELTDAQKRELERRLAAHAASPQDVVSWEQAKASALTRIGR
jgi:putative addiction module component (TIGR02574 family)